jgi:hypothetical protein
VHNVRPYVASIIMTSIVHHVIVRRRKRTNVSHEGSVGEEKLLWSSPISTRCDVIAVY